MKSRFDNPIPNWDISIPINSKKSVEKRKQMDVWKIYEYECKNIKYYDKGYIL